MNKNVGGLDRQVRVALGAILGAVSLAILANYLEAQMILSPVLGVISLLLLATGYTQKCPVSDAVGRDTYEE